MSVEKFWMVVDISSAIDATGDIWWGRWVPKHRAPTFMHDELESAERECLRLQKKHPSGEFVILEAVAYAKPVGVGSECCLRDIERSE